MPSVINGIGTWYYGKRNIHRERGSCRFCGAWSDLRSYDTTLWFTVLFVPILPLGRRKIFAQCPRCTQHLAMSMRQWQRVTAEGILKALETWRADRRNEQRAAELLDTAIAAHEMSGFEELAREVEGDLPRSPLVQRALAEGYEFFARPHEARRHYEQALRLGGGDETRRSFAVHLLRQGEPRAAEEQLRHIFEQPDDAHVGLAMLLVEAWQAQGQHDEALRVLNQIDAAFPARRGDPELARYRTQSEKYRNSGRRIASPSLSVLGHSQHGRLAWLPMAIPVVLLVAALAVFTYYSVTQGRAREVHLVNGTGVPYRIELAGKSTLLRPGYNRLIQIPEGHHEVRVLGEDGEQIIRFDFQFGSGFWSRPFDSRVFVLNPDGAGALVWHEVKYTEDYKPLDEPKGRVHVGERFYALDKIDYPFVEPPDQLEISSSANVVTKTAMYFDDASAQQTLLYLAEQHGLEAAGRFALNRLPFEPEDAILSNAAMAAPAEERIAGLRPLLQKRPVLVQVHRAYQDVMEQSGREAEARQEYAGMLEAEPQNPDLLYLDGRLETDPDLALSRYRRALELQPNHAYANHAMGFAAMIVADGSSAVRHERAALTAMPQEPLFGHMLLEALRLDGDWTGLAETAASLQPSQSLDKALLSEEMIALHKSGRPEAAHQALEREIQRVKTLLSEPAAQAALDTAIVALRAQMQALVAYAMGDPQPLLAMLDRNDDHDAIVAAIIEKDVEATLTSVRAAAASGSIVPAQFVSDLLAAYLLAAHRGNTEAASEIAHHFTKAAGKHLAGHRHVARWLSGDAPSAQMLLHLALTPDEKCVALAAVGLRHPAVREQAFALARKLNVNPGFPALLLQDVLREE